MAVTKKKVKYIHFILLPLLWTQRQLGLGTSNNMNNFHKCISVSKSRHLTNHMQRIMTIANGPPQSLSSMIMMMQEEKTRFCNVANVPLISPFPHSKALLIDYVKSRYFDGSPTQDTFYYPPSQALPTCGLRRRIKGLLPSHKQSLLSPSNSVQLAIKTLVRVRYEYAKCKMSIR